MHERVGKTTMLSTTAEAFFVCDRQGFHVCTIRGQENRVVYLQFCVICVSGCLHINYIVHAALTKYHFPHTPAINQWPQAVGLLLGASAASLLFYIPPWLRCSVRCID